MTLLQPQRPVLRRTLSLPLLILYGIGVTIGAGIYVLIGQVAGHAGRNAPLAFVLAAIIMGLTVTSYAELCARYPVAAGEAAYVRAAFGSRALSKLTGFIMLGSAVIASATIALGAAGYVRQFIDWPDHLIVAIIVIALGLVSAWGVLESVLLACLFTVIEVSGLIAIVVVGVSAGVPIGDALFALPSWSPGAWMGIAFASLLAFFAFTGFEDLTNMVEEAKNPRRDVPLSMAVTLVVTTVLYVLVAAVAVTAVPVDRLAASPAPLSLVYRELSGIGPAAIAIVGIVSTLNTILAQTTMATRVVYGMAQQGDLPQVLGRVDGLTSTPLLATGIIAACILTLTFVASIERLAEFTSLATLIVFALVNLALIGIRLRGTQPPPGTLRVPFILPVLGLISSVATIVVALI